MLPKNLMVRTHGVGNERGIIRKKLTERGINAMKVDGTTDVFDTVLPGFGVRVGKRRKTFFCMYRLDGKLVRHNLGRFVFGKGGVEAGSLANARDGARTAFQKVERGENPKVDSTTEQRRDRSVRGFAKVADRYFERDAKKKQNPYTQLATRRYLDIMVDAWGNRAIAEITRDDVNDLLDAIVDAGTPIKANRLFEVARRLFWYASTQRSYLPDGSPMVGMEKPAKEVKRTRWLSLAEIAAVWDAAGELAYPYGRFVQMLFLTGGIRRSDLAKARWEDIQPVKLPKRHPKERDEFVECLIIPDPTKSNDPFHVVPLSTSALRLLAALPRSDETYLFSNMGQPIGGWSKYKKRIDAKLVELDHDISPWQLHDIRRTVATQFGEVLDQPTHIAELIQNRRGGDVAGVKAVYNRAKYLRAKSRALQEWGELITAVCDENVVRLQA